MKTQDQYLPSDSQLELELQERWAERVRAEELFRGYSAELSEEMDDEDI